MDRRETKRGKGKEEGKNPFRRDRMSQAQCQIFYICWAIWRLGYSLQQVGNLVKRIWWVLYPSSKVGCEQCSKISTNWIACESRERDHFQLGRPRNPTHWTMTRISTKGEGMWWVEAGESRGQHFHMLENVG